jgi:hypothetical protein
LLHPNKYFPLLIFDVPRFLAGIVLRVAFFLPTFNPGFFIASLAISFSLSCLLTGLLPCVPCLTPLLALFGCETRHGR